MREMRHDAPRMKPLDTPIPPEAMEVIADLMLASQARDRQHPSYCELSLAKKSRRASQAEMYFGVLSAARRPTDESGSDDLQDDAGLTRQEKTVWRMYADGYRPSEIAATIGVTRPTGVRILKSAARKVAGRTNKLGGLREVYRLEVGRKAYRKPKHCPEEACRRLGYCKYPGRLE